MGRGVPAAPWESSLGLGLPKWVQVTAGGGVPLIMQSKRAVRPSTTSTSSSLRVKSGCTDGCTVSRALQVSSSARRAGRGELHAARVCAAQEAACNPPPAAAPAAEVVVAERSPRLVRAEPGCAACQDLSLHRAGGYKCVQGPHGQGWGSAGSRVPLCSPHSSTDDSSKVG